MNEDCIEISLFYLLYFLKNKPSKSIMVASGRYIVLNDSAHAKMVMKMDLIFYDFFKGFKDVWMSSRWPIYDC